MPNWKKVIVSGSDAALNSLNVTTSLTASGLIYPTVDGTAGQVLTTNGAGSLSFSSSSISASYAITASYAIFAETASSALNAQDILILVKNQSGAPIAKGVVVRITGSNNASDIPRVITASYENDNNSANTLGITNQSIANGADGFVMTEGVLKGINTNAFVSGQLIYLGATGSIIGYAPVAPLHSVRLGEVVREQSNNGSIYVRIDNGYELGELHDVVDTTTTSSYGDLLVRSGSVWTNSKQLTGSYGLTGSLTATSFTGSLFGTASWATNALTASYTPSIAGTDNYIPKFNGSSALENSVMYDSGTNIGIGTTTPTNRLQVTGTAGLNNAITSFDSSTFVRIYADTTFGSSVNWVTGTALRFATSADNFGSFTERMRIDSSGNVGIGTTSPSTRLDVRYDDGVSSGEHNVLASFSRSGTGPLVIGYRADGSNVSSALIRIGDSLPLTIGTTSANQAFTLLDNGNIGIGNSSPNGALSFADDVRTRKIVLWDGSANNDYQFYGFGVESSTMIQSVYDSTDRFLWVAGTGTTTRNELMVVQGNGNVGIGTSSPSYKLDVSGQQRITLAGYAGIEYHNTPGTWEVYVGTENNTGNARYNSRIGNHTWYANSSATMALSASGAFRLNSYGSGTFTGTATQKLAVDSSGNVIEIPIGAGPVDGSGTANYITRWVDTDTITTSSIYETGGNIGIGTTTPVSSLQVSGDVSTLGQLQITGSVGGGPSSAITFNPLNQSSVNTSYAFNLNPGGGAYGGFTVNNVDSGVNQSLLQLSAANLTGDSYINVPYTSQNISFRVGNTPQMFIAGSTGNVGISTTTPAYKLSVVGKMALNDGGNSVFIGTNAGLSDDATANNNIAIGTNSSQNNVSGSQNVAVGHNTLVANTNINNTAVGANALQNNTTALNNTAFGSFALNANTVGSSSIAVGAAALITNTTGNHNTGVGNSALRLNLSGSNNVGVGGSVMFNNANGNDNVALGWNSARYFGTGTSALTDTSGSIFLGTLARANASGEVNQIVIGMNALGLGSNSVVLGNDLITKTVLKGSVGIGTNVPMGPLEIYKANPAGLGGHLILNNDGSSVGNETAILFNDSGGGSVSGVRAAISSTTEGAPYNGDIKFKTGNTTYGSLSTRMIITGAGNVGIGTTTPVSELHVNGTSTEQFSVSYDSTRRMIIGRTTGYGWILPYTSGVSYDNLVLARDGGNVGIGTTTPAQKLEVNGNIKLSSTAGSTSTPSYIWLGNDFSNGTTRDKLKVYLYNSGTDIYGFTVGSTGDIQYHSNVTHDFYINNSFSTRINSTGVGIGTSSPSYLLDVNGTARVTTLIETSALKYKTNIQPLEPQLSKVTQLEPVTFDWLDKPQTKTNIGLIADEVEKIYPEFVSKTEDGEIEGIEYSKLTTVLIQSIKELKEIVDQQQAQINKLLSK